MLTRRRLLETTAAAVIGGAGVRLLNPAAPSTAAVLDERQLGEIRLFAGHYVPAGWLACDGRELAPGEHTALRDLLRTTYGDGTTHRLPDLRCRTAIGAGEGPGQPARPLGAHGDALAEKGTGHAGLGLTYLIAPSESGGEAVFGEVRPFAFGQAPKDWLPCDGRVLEVSQHAALFSVIETRFGGDGQKTFQLPDLRNRTPLGRGDSPRPELGTVHVGQKRDDLAESADPHPRRLHLNYCIATRGAYPSRTEPNDIPELPFVSELRAFSSPQVPDGWAECKGELLEIDRNVVLYALLGSRFGGDGHKTFALPDLRGLATAGISATHQLAHHSAHPHQPGDGSHALPFTAITWGMARSGRFPAPARP